MLVKLDKETRLTKVSIIVYDEENKENILKFAQQYNYKVVMIKHEAEEEEKKEHYHIFIFSNYKHVFRVKTLVNETQKINLFSRIDWNIKEAIEYCMHINYDYKKKYNFTQVKLIGFTASEQEHYLAQLESQRINGRIEEHTKVDLMNKLFQNQFQTLNQVRDYCKDSQELRTYFVLNIDRIIKYINLTQVSERDF